LFTSTEVDSDSDFNPGVYIPEPTRKKRERKSGAGTKQRGLKGVVDEEDEASSLGGPKRKKRRLDSLRNSRSKGKQKVELRSELC
jgi:hypothetical protein